MATPPESTAQTVAPATRPPVQMSPDTLLDASLFAGMTVVLFMLALVAPPERRRGLAGSALVAVIALCALWLFGRFGESLGSSTLVDIVRESLLALLAFAVIRASLLFVGRVLLARFDVPHILTDVLLTLALIAYAIYRLHVVGVNLAGIVTTSAVITGAIAFSAQEILGALWAGLALQGERTLRQGDWVRVGDKVGQVVQLRWRSTAIATTDDETMVIPNATLMKDKIHLVGRLGESTPKRRIAFSVDYAHAPNEVMQAIDDALRRAEIPNVVRDPGPYCVCKAFADSGITYEAVYSIEDMRHHSHTDSALMSHIFAALARHGMEIPYPRRVIQSMDDGTERRERQEIARRHAIIGEIPLFAALNAEEGDILARALQRCPFVADDVLVRQGDPADSLYVLASGRLGVFLEEGGARKPLAELHAPSYFGERGLLLGQPRAATIVAATDSLCYRLDKAGFDAILRGRPQIIDDLSAVLVQRQADNDARLQALDAEARAQQSVSLAVELVRTIRGFFGLTGGANNRRG